MNVFALSSCPLESARLLDDKRVVKMVLESAQLLSTAVRSQVFAPSEGWVRSLYSPTHLSHPVTRWISEPGYQGDLRRQWLMCHAIALASEYSQRYNGRQHKSETQVLHVLYQHYFVPLHGPFWVAKFISRLGDHIKSGDLTFVNCAARSDIPDMDYRHIPDVHQAYRLYLNARRQRERRSTHE